MLVARLEPEDVACQMKLVDLAPPVAQELVGPHRARNDLVEVISDIALGEELLALDERPAQAG
jgi:hypothetical protein